MLLSHTGPHIRIDYIGILNGFFRIVDYLDSRHARFLRGYGACGEPRCCSRFLSEFQSVSMKMAKAQGVSLNPSEITGMCGRLRCCLVYEHTQYAEACKALPKVKKRVRTPHGDGKVVGLLPLKGVVVVQIEDRRVEVPAEEVERIKA